MGNVEFKHYTVMKNEAVEGLVKAGADKIYLDMTLGGAGHSELILQNLSSEGKLISFDIDEDAIEASKPKLSKYPNSIIINDSYSNFKKHLDELGIKEITGGVLFDLGASFHQFNDGDRGFSFMKDAPLDMRMDHRMEMTARDIVNGYSEAELSSRSK